MSSLKNKIALVTGAATGIGRATAIAIAAKGAKVMVTDINKVAADETINLIKEAGGEAAFHKLDVGKKSEIEAVISKIVETEGRLDLAVNNAGIGGTMSPMHEITEENWDRMMRINLSGVFFCMQAELKAMLPKGGGRIVNVSSLAGVGGVGGGSSYAAAKHGVIGLTKTAAIEYGNYNVRVNAVCPGFIETAIIDDVPDKILEFSTKVAVPMKRIGQPNEVANTIVWLLSEESSYINGHSLFIDGGMRAR